MKVVRGSCNRCGQCCGQDTNVPAFGWSFWEICFQTDNNTDFPISALPQSRQVAFALIRDALDIPRVINIGGTNYDVLLKSGVGLVRSDTDHRCPFLQSEPLQPGEKILPCGIWNTSWVQEICKPAFPTEGFVIPDWDQSRIDFFDRHPLCSFYVNEE